MRILAAIAPPRRTHRQQQRLPRFRKGIDDNNPSMIPPTNAGTILLGFSNIMGSSIFPERQRAAPRADSGQYELRSSDKTGCRIDRAGESGYQSSRDSR